MLNLLPLLTPPAIAVALLMFVGAFLFDTWRDRSRRKRAEKGRWPSATIKRLDEIEEKISD